MKNLIAVIALAGLAGTSLGQTFSLAGPSGQNTGVYNDRATYQLDDGDSENSVGFTNGGYLVFANQFFVTGGNNVITSVESTWGSDAFAGGNGVNPGQAFDYFIWADNGGGGNPFGSATLLFSGSDVISAGSIDNNVFQLSNVPNILVPGASFFVGVGIQHAGGTFPLTVSNEGLLNRSWILGGAGWNPAAPSFGGGAGIDLNLAGLGPANAMVRANATPAPGALALLGLGGLIVGRRRR